VQIYQAALAGADAVLLIVAALNDGELTHLMLQGLKDQDTRPIRIRDSYCTPSIAKLSM
jgi:Indole-3-glycerol phosphate synthase